MRYDWGPLFFLKERGVGIPPTPQHTKNKSLNRLRDSGELFGIRKIIARASHSKIKQIRLVLLVSLHYPFEYRINYRFYVNILLITCFKINTVDMRERGVSTVFLAAHPSRIVYGTWFTRSKSKRNYQISKVLPIFQTGESNCFRVHTLY